MMRVRTFHGIGQLPAECFDEYRVPGVRDVGDEVWRLYANVPADAPELEVYDASTGEMIRRYGPGCQRAEYVRHPGSLRVRIAAAQGTLW